MKIFKLLLSIGFSIAVSQSFAQNQVEKAVFASAGDAIQSNNYRVEWTIGETITGTFDTTNKKVFQGFHHPISIITSTYDFNESALKVNLFPNPVSENELLVQFKEWTGHAKLVLFDLQGKTLWQQELQNVFNQTHKINVDFLTDGNYLLSLQEGDNQSFVKKFSIIRH